MFQALKYSDYKKTLIRYKILHTCIKSNAIVVRWNLILYQSVYYNIIMKPYATIGVVFNYCYRHAIIVLSLFISTLLLSYGHRGSVKFIH